MIKAAGFSETSGRHGLAFRKSDVHPVPSVSITKHPDLTFGCCTIGTDCGFPVV